MVLASRAYPATQHSHPRSTAADAGSARRCSPTGSAEDSTSLGRGPLKQETLEDLPRDPRDATREGAPFSFAAPAATQPRPERLGTEPVRAILPKSGRTFRRTALGELDTTTDRKDARTGRHADTVLG
jgi:hypothetical protein